MGKNSESVSKIPPDYEEYDVFPDFLFEYEKDEYNNVFARGKFCIQDLPFNFSNAKNDKNFYGKELAGSELSQLELLYFIAMFPKGGHISIDRILQFGKQASLDANLSSLEDKGLVKLIQSDKGWEVL